MKGRDKGSQRKDPQKFLQIHSQTKLKSGFGRDFKFPPPRQRSVPFSPLLSDWLSWCCCSPSLGFVFSLCLLGRGLWPLDEVLAE